MDSTVVWHTDGHRVGFFLDGDNIRVKLEQCPAISQDAECIHPSIQQCMVKYFVELYGLEINIGSAAVVSPMEIVWGAIGESHDVDNLVFYILPRTDPRFVEWFESQTIE